MTLNPDLAMTTIRTNPRRHPVIGLLLFLSFIGNGVALALPFVGWWRRSPPYRLIRFQRLLGRWSMLPVFALSLGIFFADGDHFLGTLPKAGSLMLISGLALVIIGQFIVRRAWRPHSAVVSQDSPASPTAPFS